MKRRAEEISAAITTHGASRTYFVTFTLRHTREMCFELLQKFETNAFGLMFSGRDGAELAGALGGPMRPPQSKRKAVPLVLKDLVPPPPGEPFPEDWRPAKPYSVRAHDRTWSLEHGFHPHLHCLLFLHQAVQSEEWLRDRLLERWRACLTLALDAFNDLVWRVLHYDPPSMDRALLADWSSLSPKARLRALRRWKRDQLAELVHPETGELAAERPLPTLRVLRTWVGLADGSSLEEALETWLVAQWEKLKGRCEKVFGARMVRRVEELKDGSVRDIPFEESIERIRTMLVDFKPHELMPVHGKAGEAFAARAVDVEQVRRADRVPRYLAKLGCELAGMMSKTGKQDEYGIVHYGMWQLANIAADESHQLYEQARGAWKELYRATKGTQTLTWSQEAREGLGIDPVRDEDVPQEQPSPTEMTRGLGQIDPVIWDNLALKGKHRFLARIYELHARGQIDELRRLGILRTEGIEHSTEPRPVKPDEPERAPAYWNRREPGDNTAEPREVMVWSDEARAYVPRLYDPSDARPRSKPPPAPDPHLKTEPPSEQVRRDAAERYVENRVHGVSPPDAQRQLERATTPVRKVVRLPWEKMTPEEREEALHQCRDHMQALDLLIGGPRPHRRAVRVDRDADEAADPIASFLEAFNRDLRVWDAATESWQGEPEQIPLREFLISFERSEALKNATPTEGVPKAGEASRFSPSLQERYGREGVLPGFGAFVKPGV